MPLRLGTNITAINAGRNLNTNTNDFTKRVERLASGLRINRGADDAAGLSLSEGMRLELSGMREGVRNAAQGISLVQLAEGSLNETSNMLIRMRELAVETVPSPITSVPWLTAQPAEVVALAASAPSMYTEKRSPVLTTAR